jgi:hypothetical protein
MLFVDVVLITNFCKWFYDKDFKRKLIKKKLKKDKELLALESGTSNENVKKPLLMVFY